MNKHIPDMTGTARFIFKFSVMAALLLGLPLVGVMLAGYPAARYFEFPPRSRYVVHAPYSGWIFTAHLIFILVITGPLVVRAWQGRQKKRPVTAGAGRFPWWGWAGTACGVVSWFLAWTRQDWFDLFQRHTFIPLWLSYIVVINAIAYHRSGRCMMVNRPGYFLALFPTSAIFWWFFEYLNRFVQNWYYPGVHFNAQAYFCYATLSFSTVLPAVLGTREVIANTAWLQNGFKRFFPVAWPYPRLTALAILLLASGGLIGIGVWPNLFYPLLWVSPLLIIVSLQALMHEDHVLAGIGTGDWRLIVASAAAALVCGGFWEMWNFFSLAKWKYSIPFVDRYSVFEMPVLGYAGYLPFGLECTVVGAMLEKMLPGFKRPR